MNVFLFFLSLFLVFGWIVPFAIGIRRMRKRQAFGWPLAIIGGGWFFCFMIFGAATISFVASRGEPQRFDPDSFAGPIGELEHRFDGEVAVVLQDLERNHEWIIKSSEKRILVPAGAYSNWTFSASLPDKRSWQITSTSKRDNLIVRELPAPPSRIPPVMNAIVSMKIASDRTATAALAVTDADGNPVTLTVPGQLRFEALDSARKVIWSGSFAYG